MYIHGHIAKRHFHCRSAGVLVLLGQHRLNAVFSIGGPV